jgi:hypothetical protein
MKRFAGFLFGTVIGFATVVSLGATDSWWTWRRSVDAKIDLLMKSRGANGVDGRKARTYIPGRKVKEYSGGPIAF